MGYKGSKLDYDMYHPPKKHNSFMIRDLNPALHHRQSGDVWDPRATSEGRTYHRLDVSFQSRLELRRFFSLDCRSSTPENLNPRTSETTPKLHALVALGLLCSCRCRMMASFAKQRLHVGCTERLLPLTTRLGQLASKSLRDPKDLRTRDLSRLDFGLVGLIHRGTNIS